MVRRPRGFSWSLVDPRCEYSGLTLALFSQGCLERMLVRLGSKLNPVSVVRRSGDNPLPSLRCMKSCLPDDLTCSRDPTHLITYTSLSLPTFRDLTQPEGEEDVSGSVQVRLVSSNLSSLRRHLPADQHSVQRLPSARRHRRLLRYPLHRRPLLFRGSEASSPGDDHRYENRSK